MSYWGDLGAAIMADARDRETAEERAARIADAEADHFREIDDLRDKLSSAIIRAQCEINTARHALDELTSNRVYDVDLAETSDGTDIGAFLDDARRFLRAAGRLVPSPDREVA